MMRPPFRLVLRGTVAGLGMAILLGAAGATEPSSQAVLPATSAPVVGRFPHITVDVAGRRVSVECKAVRATYPLEFLACRTNSNEYESVVRTDAQPSDLHLALLMIGLTPGQPLHFDPQSSAWVPPSGSAVEIAFGYLDHGRQVEVPAYRWLRDINTHQPATSYAWCFAGSSVLPDGTYAADRAGPLVGVINNALSVLDVPALRSRSLDARQWERNAELMPPTDTPVTMILAPAAAITPATTP